MTVRLSTFISKIAQRSLLRAHLRTVWLSASASAAMALLSGTALAQQPTTVQLPTFRFFSMSTTVSVPDLGTTHAGGLQRSSLRNSRRGFGPLAQNDASRETGASGVRVSATIHDFEAMDEALLAEASAHRAPWRTDVDIAAEMRAIEARRSTASTSLPGSVSAIRAEQAAASEAKQAELRALLAKAESLENEGKPGVAKIYYSMVARRDTGELAQIARERLNHLSAPR